MKISHYLLFLTLLIAAAISCSTGPDFERDNPIDFDGNDYSPLAPLIQKFIRIDENDNVPISWEDKSDFGTGFRVYKSLGNDNSTRIFLAELDKKITTYIDTTKVFAFPTRYYVSSFFDSSESSTTTQIEWEDIVTDFVVELQNNYKSVEISWETGISTFALDGLILESRTDNDSVFKTIDVFSAPNQKYFRTDYTLPTPENGFRQEFRVIPFKIYKSDTTLSKYNRSHTISTGPQNLKLEFSSPNSLKATWVDLNDFEDSFQITLTYDTIKDGIISETVTLDKNTNSYVFVKDFRPESSVKVELIGLHNGYASPKIYTYGWVD